MREYFFRIIIVLGKKIFTNRVFGLIRLMFVIEKWGIKTINIKL